MSHQHNLLKASILENIRLYDLSSRFWLYKITLSNGNLSSLTRAATGYILYVHNPQGYCLYRSGGTYIMDDYGNLTAAMREL